MRFWGLHAKPVASCPTFTTRNLPPPPSSRVKHWLPLFAPGPVGACRPPPVQLLTLRALSSTHFRVRSEPHCLAASAKSSHADHACAPRRAFAFAPGLYFANASRYCCIAGLVEACSNGTKLLGMYVLAIASPPTSSSFWS